VLPVDGGEKKIAYRVGCRRTGPVCEMSTEAVGALREIPRLATALGLSAGENA
jgi:hypothetical protein